jgi:hypothetical protein
LIGALCVAAGVEITAVWASFAEVLAGLPGGAEAEAWNVLLVRNAVIAFASVILCVALLRSVGARIARTATPAISVLLAVVVPVGTAAFAWWFFSIRKREARESA